MKNQFQIDCSIFFTNRTSLYCLVVCEDFSKDFFMPILQFLQSKADPVMKLFGYLNFQ